MDRLAKLFPPLILATLSAALVPTRLAGQARPPDKVAVPGYGTSGTSYYRQAFSEFFPSYGSADYFVVGDSTHIGRAAPAGVGLVGPQPHLPGGALLTYVELDFCDTSSTGFVHLDLFECSYTGECSGSPLTGLSSGGPEMPGCSYAWVNLEPLNYTIDNYTRQIFPVVYTEPDNTAYLAGVIYGYRLQVSPAPATATFNDVPVGHQFHRYVEALVNSGITAGCGNGNFCPNNAVTRGQMAAFLSIALGLHWSQ